MAKGESKFYNLGSGKGYSNKQVMETVKKVTGVDFKVVYGPRRPGDPDILLASSDKIKSELGWQPAYDNLEEIITTAWEWQKKREIL